MSDRQYNYILDRLDSHRDYVDQNYKYIIGLEEHCAALEDKINDLVSLISEKFRELTARIENLEQLTKK